ALFLGAAVMSLFVPASRLTQTRSGRKPEPVPELFEHEIEEAAYPPARMLALVQTRPQCLVLAISESREELEREMQELNETWNHWQIRSERQRYEIQPAPVLRRGVDELHIGRLAPAARSV
ncbi:MAG: hypothetical protein JWL62_868, partial [Hyphomicrobiales bacterium]|nr:hypothetical protein [Hyphomicrobiales bacterium]